MESLKVRSLCGLVDGSPRVRPNLDRLLMETEQGEVVRLLACSAEQKAAAKEVVDRIVTQVLHPEFHPIEVYESGSFKRGTAIFYNFDVDLVLKLRSFNYGQMKEYFKSARSALIDQLGSDISFKRESSHRCLPFEVGGDALKFDLLVTGDPVNNRFSNPRDYYSPAGSYEADRILIAAKHKYPVLQAFVMLCKHWKNEYKGGDYFLKSYYVELLCYQILKGNKESGESSISSLRVAFRLFLEAFIEGRTVPNVNPHAEPHCALYAPAGRVFQAYAKETYQRFFAAHNSIQYFPCSGSLASARSGEEFVDRPSRSTVDNNNPGDRATSHFVAEWEGECRYVARGEYTGGLSGEACVVKWFKTGAVFEETFYEKDLKAVEKAAEIINAFNLCGVIDGSIKINRPGVWRKETDQQKMLVEPMLPNFRKFNSNTGYVRDQGSIMQALSHFSHHYSHGELLLCDLQGCQQGRDYILTDPVVLSRSKQFGLTDLGEHGMENFFFHHRCNGYCRGRWTKTHGKHHYEPQEGSAFSSQALRRPLLQANMPRQMNSVPEEPDNGNYNQAEQALNQVIPFFLVVVCIFFFAFCFANASQHQRY